MTHPNFFPPLLEGKIFRAFGAIMVYKDYAIFINYQHLLHQIAPQAKILRFLHSKMMISIAKSIENRVQISKFSPTNLTGPRWKYPPLVQNPGKTRGGYFLLTRVIAVEPLWIRSHE